jgi:hypothetical protein
MQCHLKQLVRMPFPLLIVLRTVRTNLCTPRTFIPLSPPLLLESWRHDSGSPIFGT